MAADNALLELDLDESVVTAAFHPVEAAIVREYLGLPPRPDESSLDVWNHAGELPTGVVHLEDADGSVGDCGLDRAASDAVARLVLAGYEGTLPVWGCVREGEVTITRKDRRPRKGPVRALPLMLLEVNWADSGPGFSWPEAHHLGWLTGFNRWVVTASRDTPEIDGYCDRVLDTFAHCEDAVARARDVIQGYWQSLKDEYGQERWEYLFEEGRLTASDAEAMASAVWAEEPEDEG
jgi:hypothetical protein